MVGPVQNNPARNAADTRPDFDLQKPATAQEKQAEPAMEEPSPDYLFLASLDSKPGISRRDWAIAYTMHFGDNKLLDERPEGKKSESDTGEGHTPEPMRTFPTFDELKKLALRFGLNLEKSADSDDKKSEQYITLANFLAAFDQMKAGKKSASQAKKTSPIKENPDIISWEEAKPFFDPAGQQKITLEANAVVKLSFDSYKPDPADEGKEVLTISLSTGEMLEIKEGNVILVSRDGKQRTQIDYFVLGPQEELPYFADKIQSKIIRRTAEQLEKEKDERQRQGLSPYQYIVSNDEYDLQNHVFQSTLDDFIKEAISKAYADAPEGFKYLDRINKDGIFDQNEALDTFDLFDENYDGNLNPKEFAFFADAAKLSDVIKRDYAKGMNLSEYFTLYDRYARAIPSFDEGPPTAYGIMALKSTGYSQIPYIGGPVKLEALFQVPENK